jgi:hypothetical protein
VLEPVEPGDFARVYIDDGTGLEPTFGQQPYEELLQSTSGQERRFRVAQFPVTPAMAEGAESGPFVITSGQAISVKVDEILETYIINGDDYQNLSAATAYEIVRDLNAQSNIVGFRTLDGGSRIAAIDLSGTAETLQIFSGDLQATLGFPTAILRPIFLYDNSDLQSFRGHTGTLETRPRNAWGLSLSDLQNVRVSVDGVVQTITIDNNDFAEFQTTITTSTIEQWATVLSRKIAGVKFTVSGQILVWSTYQTFSATGSLEILEERADGTPAGWIGDTKMWQSLTSGGILSDTGYPKNYKFNRFTGEINFVVKPLAGHKIEVGSRTTRAFVRSEETTSGLYSLAPVLSTVGNARFVCAFDGEYAIREISVPAGSQFTPTIPDGVNAPNVVRLTANAKEIFQNAEVGDWLYLVQDQNVVPGWGSDIEGFYRLKAIGHNLFAADENYLALVASTTALSSASASVKKDSDIVTIQQTGHGFKTGDLITVTTAPAIGGISGANLSVTDALITVLGDNYYTYVAGANATSDDTGLLDSVGNNVVTATHSSHGFTSGAYISVTTVAAIGGISGANLSITNSPIEYVDVNTYKFRAAAASTSTDTGNLATLTYKADTWIEFEASTPQLADWTPELASAQTLSPFMIHLFLATTTPQLVDFGNAISTADVDTIVGVVNDQIVSGVAEKLTPQQLAVRSGDFEEGTCAILATVGNAVNLFAEEVASSSQAHVAYSASDNIQAGFPVIKSIEVPTTAANGYPTRTYVEMDRDLTDILDESDNPTIQSPSTFVANYPVGFQHMWMTGRQAGLAGRVYNNQTTQPFSGVMRGENALTPLNTSDTFQTSPASLDRYANFGLRFQDIPFNNYDKLVVEMDLDPTDKTVSVPIAKIATIQDIDPIAGSGKGQVISFRLKDPEDSDLPFFDNTSVYKDFDFADFKILTKSVGVYQDDLTSDRAMILRSVDYGAPNQLVFSVRLPLDPDQADFLITHNNIFVNDVAHLRLVATLPSDALIAGSVRGSGTYKVTAAVTGTLYNWRLTAPNLNSGNEYAPGNVLNISGSANTAGSYEVLSDSYGDYSSLTANVTQGSNVVVVTQAGHGFETGDLANITVGSAIGGIPSSALTVSDAELTKITVNTFSYVASAFTP